MSTSTTLEAAAQDRKARLAQLRSLKRKQAPTDEDQNDTQQDDHGVTEVKPTDKYISGRNYDVETRGAKLGFEFNPSEGAPTLEQQAQVIAEATKRQAEEEEKANKPLDLFKLQPKKPNWDLKRDLDRKLETLNVRTDNAIAKMVRERIVKAQAEAKAKGTDTNGDATGMEGAELVEAMHQREREEEEDERRAKEEETEDGL